MGHTPVLQIPAAPSACFGGCCIFRERRKSSKASPVLAIPEPFLKGYGQQEAPDAEERVWSVRPDCLPESQEGSPKQCRKTKWVAAFASAALLAAAMGGPPASSVWTGIASNPVLGIVPIIASLAWATAALLANKNPSSVDGILGDGNQLVPGANDNAKEAVGYANMDEDEIKAAKWHQGRQQQAEAALPTLEALLAAMQLQDPEGFLSNKLTLLRYLRACNAPPNMPVQQHAEAAMGRLQHTLAWRREVLVEGNTIHRTKVDADTKRYHFSCPCCRADPRAHCYFPLGLDRRNRLVVYSSAARAANKDMTGIAHIICELEANFRDNSPLGPQQIVWIVDFRGFSARHTDPRVGYEAVKVFGKHYPERLGQIVLLGFPAAFHFLYQLIHAVLDPVTRTKIRILRRPQDREAYLKKYWPDSMRSWLAAADELPPVEGVVLPSLPGGSGDPRVSTASRVV